MGRKKSLSTFELIFTGEYVEIVSNLIGGQGQEGLPLIIQGFLLDVDEKYFYIGSTHNEVSQAIKKDDVVFISIIEESDELKEVLKSIPTPKNKEEGN